MIKSAMNPDMIDGVAVCSREKCKCFISVTQSGWGICNECIRWNSDKYGRERNFSLIKKTLCRPYVEEVIEKEYLSRCGDQ